MKMHSILPQFHPTSTTAQPTRYQSFIKNHPIQRSKVVSIILFVLAVLAITTHLLTSSDIPSLSNGFAHTIAGAKSSNTDSCTTLSAEAQPCVEVCRREFVDRETMEMMVGFGECERKCLKTYFAEGCTGGERVGAEVAATEIASDAV
ncbi:unnamed protein product [Periconia digitata]|uniref:Uncharacterized protein n=1 Tax=Periconia digitata TaxID=1303443 RepID=A0A9W4UBX8_9PLEO|nr:unnamed protein product [Periconia digitata]